MDAMPVDDEMTAKTQCRRFAFRPQRLVLDRLEIGVMGKTKNTAMDFDAGKAEQIPPQRMQHMVERLLGTQRIVAVLEQSAVIEHPGSLRAPQSREFGAKHGPYLGDRAQEIGAHG